jgi:nitric oxide reductase NorE protein
VAPLPTAPGEAGGGGQAPAILTFIVADLAAFALFFAFFMIGRHEQAALFDRSAALLNADVGAINALILITSSWLVVVAVQGARQGDRRAVRRFLALAFAVGAGFAVSKAMEYGDKLAHGITLLSNDFFMFYYVLTGIHFLHFMAGMAVLAMLWFKAGQEAVDGPLLGWIESGGLYWHMVDLLWIVLFPMLYLLGRQ